MSAFHCRVSWDLSEATRSASKNVGPMESKLTFLRLIILLLSISRSLVVILRLLAVQLANVLNLALALVGGG